MLLKKRSRFFTKLEADVIINAIRLAEQGTSGEIRLYVESHCSWINAIDRAAEVFLKLKMEATSLRNGVLFYVAMKDKQLAVYGDSGIHQTINQSVWDESVNDIVQHFSFGQYVKGLESSILKMGEIFKQVYPTDSIAHKNELPDEIVFGK